MNELKMRGMKSDPGNQLFRRFSPVVFPVAYDRVAARRKLHPDLVLQSCHQFNPDERGIRKNALNGISKFGAGRLRVPRRPQLLEHSFASKIMDQRPGLNAGMATHYRQVLPHGCMGQKLLHKRISVPFRFRK